MSSLTIPKISLVLATYNRVVQLSKLLESLKNQTLNPKLWDVIICDDGSTDDTLSTLNSLKNKLNYNLRFVTQKNQGQCIGRHYAILQSHSTYIVIIDDDMEIVPGFMEFYLKAFQDDKRRIIIGRVHPRNNWQKYPMYEAMREHYMAQSHAKLALKKLKPTGTYFITQNVGFPRDFYLEVGGFDPNLKLYEDCELGWRFEKNGAEFYFCNEASAVHHSNIGSYEKWIKRHFEYGKYAVYIWEKYNRDLNLHPLRNFINGSSLYRNLFLSAMWGDFTLKITSPILRLVGDTFKALGMFKVGLYAYRAIQNFQYNLGVLDKWGKDRFLKEGQEFSLHPNRPLRPLGEGPVFIGERMDNAKAVG